MLSYGVPVMGKGSLFVIYEKAIETMVARNFGVEMVGFYSKGRELPNIANAIVSKSITRVSFSDLTQLPSMSVEVQAKFQRYFYFAVLGMSFLGLIFAGGAHYISSIFYGSAWLALTPMIVVFSVSLGIQAMTNFYHSIMKNFDMTRTSLLIFAAKGTCHGLFLVFVELTYNELLYSLVIVNLAELIAVMVMLRKMLNGIGMETLVVLCFLVGILVLAALYGDLSAGGFGWWLLCFAVWSVIAYKGLRHQLAGYMRSWRG